MHKNIISLGWFCGTASSMSRHGYRSCTTPFDWCFSEIKGVMEVINCDFKDFLLLNNIEVKAENRKHFIDKKYMLTFIHDVKNDFDKEYTHIYSKYLKKIDSFRLMSKQGAIYLRAIKNQDEILFIENNKGYIEETIKKYNNENEIVFLINPQLKITSKFSFCYFYINENCNGSSVDSLRSMFDTNAEFLQYLDKQYDIELKKDNLIYDLKKENSRLKNITDKYYIIEKLQSLKIEPGKFPNRIAIYGIGVIGKYLYQLLKDRVEVVYIIDNNELLSSYDNVPIYKLEDDYETDIKIIITPSHVKHEITTLLIKEKKISASNIISVDELY